jgi:cation transport ATPase
VNGHRVTAGSRSFARTSGVPEAEIVSTASTTTRGSGEAHVVVAIDGHVAAVIVMADELRPDAERIVDRLSAEGVRSGARHRRPRNRDGRRRRHRFL